MYFNQTVTVSWFSRDRHGDKTPVESVDVPGCAFAPGGSSEDTDHKEQVIRDGSLYVPPGVHIDGSAVLTLPDNTQWHVIGATEQYESPFSNWRPGGEVRIRRVTG